MGRQSRQNLVIGNWKMHGDRAANSRLLDALREAQSDFEHTGVAVCPPFVYLDQAVQCLADSRIAVGGQNVSAHESGAYTGEVAAQMLADLGCHYVIVGHSERRELFAETDAQIGEKFARAQAAGLKPILCVGETLAQREAGDTLAVIEQQLNAVLDAVGVDALQRAVVAYEPVWAIGTGRTATPEQAQDVHGFIRQTVAARSEAVAMALPLLYGGSVKPENAGSLFAQADIDGGLVGGASLKADAFVAICRAAEASGR